MNTPSANDALAAYLRLDNTELRKYLAEGLKDLDGWLNNMGRFLGATMDQVRVRLAWECTRKILEIMDLDDLEVFREGVWKREATRGMAYADQRDHTAHTLNNWLLGWYFYDHVPKLRTAMKKAIRTRAAGTSIDTTTYFGHVWQYASLLHDIGYLFEGSLGAMESEYESRQAAIGLEVADEYFQLLLWKHMKLTSISAENKSAILPPPETPATPSLSRIALYLRNVGNLDELCAKVSSAKAAKARQSLPADAFDLWEAHFKAFGYDKAAARIVELERGFMEILTKGMSKAGIRVLDHGACSGLLQVKIATYYYRLNAYCEQVLASSSSSQAELAAAKSVKDYELSQTNPAHYAFWWGGILWGSASAALHNLLQQSKQYDGHMEAKLGLEEEPLTYLGILVDCLQDWDRYFVFSTRHREPIQGRDVPLEVVSGKVRAVFSNKDRAAKLEKELSSALTGWKTLLDLKSAS